jgi:hypothetical protein
VALEEVCHAAVRRQRGDELDLRVANGEKGDLDVLVRYWRA